MPLEEKQRRDSRAGRLLITLVWTGLFLTSGMKWFDRYVPDAPFGKLLYVLLPVAALSSAIGLVRFVSSLRGIKTLDC
jgi:hypothetical protein